MRGVPTGLVLAGVLAALLAPALAADPAPSPYAGDEASRLKALSDPELADLRRGRGMGHARAAALNGSPGPRPGLALAGARGLAPAPAGAVQRLFPAPHRTARLWGKR